jgi:hypothetical protein
MSDKQRVEATVYGRVQGVSFRYYTQQKARQLGLTGWVANHPDGSVRLVAEGPRPGWKNWWPFSTRPTRRPRQPGRHRLARGQWRMAFVRRTLS